MNIVRNTISLSFFARLTFKTETENNSFKQSKSELFEMMLPLLFYCWRFLEHPFHSSIFIGSMLY